MSHPIDFWLSLTQSACNDVLHSTLLPTTWCGRALDEFFPPPITFRHFSLQTFNSTRVNFAKSKWWRIGSNITFAGCTGWAMHTILLIIRPSNWCEFVVQFKGSLLSHSGGTDCCWPQFTHTTTICYRQLALVWLCPRCHMSHHNSVYKLEPNTVRQIEEPLIHLEMGRSETLISNHLISLLAYSR